jgi:hypothetical protein
MDFSRKREAGQVFCANSGKITFFPAGKPGEFFADFPQRNLTAGRENAIYDRKNRRKKG